MMTWYTIQTQYSVVTQAPMESQIGHRLQSVSDWPD